MLSTVEFTWLETVPVEPTAAQGFLYVLITSVPNIKV